MPKQEFIDLQTQVGVTVGAEASAKTLIDGFAAQLTAAIDQEDWDAVKSLRDDLQTSSDALAASVASVVPAPPPAGGGHSNFPKTGK